MPTRPASTRFSLPPAVLGLAVAVATLSLGSSALAKPADGRTPAAETICDDLGLSGSARGLCNAYCEALDCDSASTKASPVACASLGRKLEAAAPGATRCTVEPPAVCPCFTAEDLALITSAESCHRGVNLSCDGGTFRIDVLPETSLIAICEPGYPEDAIVTVSGPYEGLTGGTKTNEPLAPGKCWFETVEEVRACQQLVENQCQSLGL